MTKAELILWTRLREANRHGFKLRRQHAIAPFIADYAQIRGQLVIEIDGATHGSEEERAYDARRFSSRAAGRSSASPMRTSMRTSTVSSNI